MLTNFLVNSALMVAMLVKLLLFLIASKTSPVSSLKVSFSSSKYALCYKIFFFNSFTFLFFSFFLRDCQYFQMRDANFLSRVILVVVSSFEVFWNSSWSTFTHSKLPKNITTCHLQRVLEYGLPYKGLFTFCRWIITNLLQNSRCHSTVAKQDLHLPTSSLLIQPSTLAMNFVIFDMLPTSRFSDDCFPIRQVFYFYV